MKKRKVAVFDIDGTIFRSSLLIEVVEILVRNGAFPSKAKDFYGKLHNNWLARKGSYEEYIGAVIAAFERNIKEINYTDFLKATEAVNNFHRHKIYRYTADMVKKLKNKNYFLLAISNSPKELVDSFCGSRGFDKVYGRVYEVGKNGKFTSKTLYSDLISDKAKILRRAVKKENLTLRDSVGVGDTESDINFLELVENPVCFNPNKKLYDCAKRRGWKIIVERKDVIYKI